MAVLGPLEARLPRRESRAHAPGIGNVLAERELPIDVQGLVARAVDGEVRILAHEALGSLLKGFDRPVRPPVRVVPILVVVPASGVEGVRQLVSGHGAEGAIAQVLWDVHVEDGELHDASGKDDFVAGRVVIGIHGRNCHAPGIAIDGFAEGGPFMRDFEAGHGERVGEEGGRGNVYGSVVVLEG